MQVREPVPRSLDTIAAELLLSASQAFLVGVLMYLAIGIWDDRGVGFGPVAVTLAGLGLVVGGAWLYWISGGVGWPLAAANVPVAIFLGFALVLGWQGDDVVRVEGVPLILSLIASVYGLVCGVFLDSPRRRRWDQRQKPRPGAPVPRISPTTRMVVARVPRSVPRRSTATPSGFPTLPQAQAGAPAGAQVPPTGAGLATQGTTPDGIVRDAAGPELTDASSLPGSGSAAVDGTAVGSVSEAAPAATSKAATAKAATAKAASSKPATPAPSMPTDRLDRAARATADEETEAVGDQGSGIELPTSLEPKAQRSPWAWAAPPEWTRDEDDEPPQGRSSGRA